MSVQNNTGLPYKEGTVTLTVAGNSVNGKVYSLQNATEEQIYSDYENADKSTVNSYYKPQFKYSADLGGQLIAKTDDGDEFCYREGDTIYAMFPSGDTKEYDLSKFVNISKYTGQDLNLQITCKNEAGDNVPVTDGKVSLTSAGIYTVTYTVTDSVFFDKDGNSVTDTKGYSWDVDISVSLKDTAVPNAYFAFDTSKQKMGYYVKSSIFSTSVYQYIPFLAGLKIYDYNGQEEYLRFDGDNDFNKVAKIEVTNKYSGNIALVKVTLTDGGVIELQLLARADSGGGSTYEGSIKTNGNTIYFVNNGTTSESDTGSTTTAAYWYVRYYKITGNNGTPVEAAKQTFNSSGTSSSTPSGSFSTSIKYTVSYEANEGNCGQTVGYATSASAAVTLPTATRSGYLFSGWYTAASGGTYIGAAGESYTPSANITLYAQWSKPCTVTYDANGGTCDTASEKYSGTALTLPTATRDGYILSGWYTAAEGGSKVGDAGDSYKPSTEITLYAQWTDATREVTVTYDATTNGGSCSTKDATVVAGNNVTLPTPDSRTGYKFSGWYTAASGGTLIGTAGATYAPAADVTLYAQWTGYKVTYNANGGTVTPSSVTYAGTALTLPTPTRDGYTFNGWYTAASGGTLIGAAGATYTPEADITLYAQWTEDSSGDGCITPETLITLADGSRVQVQHLTGEDELLVWNLETGSYDTAPIVFVDSDEEATYEVIDLYFSDGSKVGVIYEHGFFDVDLAEYVYITAENAKDYIGHSFVTQADIENNTWNIVTLEDVVIENRVTRAYSPVTFKHLCYYTDGVLSMPGGINGLFNIFEVDTEIMAYDAEQKAADIETYGLFTYADFEGVVSEVAYEAFNGNYLKVAIGKGLLTWEDIEYLAQHYMPLISGTN